MLMSQVKERHVDQDQVTCPKCNNAQALDAYGMNIIDEAALLICPVCSAEFSLTATLTKSGEESPEEPEQPSHEEQPEELPPEQAPTQPAQPGQESKQNNIRVLTCGKCKAEWVSAPRSTCAFCGESGVTVSAKTVRERCREAIEEEDRGVPASRVLEKLLGKVQEDVTDDFCPECGTGQPVEIYGGKKQCLTCFHTW